MTQARDHFGMFHTQLFVEEGQRGLVLSHRRNYMTKVLAFHRDNGRYLASLVGAKGR